MATQPGQGRLLDEVLVDFDVFEVAAVGMVITDRCGRFRRVNSAFAHLLGRSREELLGTAFSALTSPDDVGRSQEALADLATKVIEVARFEKRYLRPDGSVVWVDLTARSLTDPRGQVVAFLAQGADITDRKTMEFELVRATEEAQRLALVARVAPSAVAITDPVGRIEWVNDAFTRLTGYRSDQAIGRLRTDLLHGPGSQSTEMASFAAKILAGEPADGEFCLTDAAGREYVTQIEVRHVIEDGTIAHLVGVERDITERRRGEAALRIARARAEALAEALECEKELLMSVISAVPHMVFWKDDRHRYVGCNSAYLTFRGYPDVTHLLGRDEADLGSRADLTDLLNDLEHTVQSTGAPILDRQVQLTGSDGSCRALLISVLPLAGTAHGGPGIIGVAADVTQVRDMEHRLAQASRLESIGQLAAGIAHEINTPVQYIASNTAFLSEATHSLLDTATEIAGFRHGSTSRKGDCTRCHPQLSELVAQLDLEFLVEEVPHALSESQEGLTRLTQIVRAMKDYAHPGTSLQDADINQVIETTKHVCRNEWKYVATLRLDLDPDVGLIPCYPGELKQAVLNLLINASQALAEQRVHDPALGLGTITVSTRREGQDVVITISDDGPGMAENVRQHVFEPFFTTKEIGKGTGQGLSLAQSIVVSKHHGQIDVVSSPGCGTCFTIRLPACASPPPTPRDDES